MTATYGLPDFLTMPERAEGERAQRLANAHRVLSYGNRFLDDCIRGIGPHDLILLGAPTGMGKTDLALSIAMSNARAGKHVAYFALEAEPNELERRAKYGRICELMWAQKYTGAGRGPAELNYTDWVFGRCEDMVGDMDRIADEWIAETLGGMRTFYRGAHFDAGNLQAAIETVHDLVDLIVVDHLHYVDADAGEDEHRALGDAVKTIRDVSLRIGKPVLLVAHLRKKASGAKTLVPSIDDFHGSSNVTKIATQVITIERATGTEMASNVPWYRAPTFVCVLKNRREGDGKVVALSMFDRRTKRYEKTYDIGRLTSNGAGWEPFEDGQAPIWAKHSNQRSTP